MLGYFMPGPKRPKRPNRARKSKENFFTAISREVDKAIQKHARITARQRFQHIFIRVSEKTVRALERHIAELPDLKTFRPAEFFREKDDIVNYALRLFDSIYRDKRVVPPLERAFFLGEFQRRIILEKGRLREVMDKINEDRRKLLELKENLSPEEFELDMRKLDVMEVKIKTYQEVTDALLRRAEERMRMLK
jgi:hypothetical protein